MTQAARNRMHAGFKIRYWARRIPALANHVCAIYESEYEEQRTWHHSNRTFSAEPRVEVLKSIIGHLTQAIEDLEER